MAVSTYDIPIIRLAQGYPRVFPNRLICTFIFLSTFVILHLLPASASEELGDQFLKDDDPKVPWHITADKIHHEQKTDEYFAWGNVTITKSTKKLTADFVRFNHRAMKVLATGHVIMTAGRDIMTGTRLEMDLRDEAGVVYNGTIFFDANHFYIKGDTIHKTGRDSYNIDRATITTCDGEHPAWKITGRNLKVTIEGYGTITHAALWAKSMPVFYSPFFVFPAKVKRQSGLLPPQIGFSDRKGTEFIQPFFWAISESTDATIYDHYMEHRGNKIGLEYRYVLDDVSKGTLMVDGFNDRQTDDGTGESSNRWGYTDDNALRPNSDRYWFRAKIDQTMPSGFNAKFDLDIVSDQDYLHEFKDGYTGFDHTERYYTDTFNRELEDYTDPVRVNRLNFSRTWPKYSLNADIRWYDNVVTRRQSNTDTTLQKLPVVEFNGAKQPVFNTYFYFDLDSEYTYFFRQDGDKGHRMDLYPRLYFPYRFKNYFSFEPSVGVRETVWNIDEDENTSAKKDYKLHREIYDIKLDLSTEIFRVYNVGGKKIDRFKHAVRPQIIYDYIPEQEQDKYPYFDSIDRIGRNNLLTYSITNTFTSRAPIYIENRKEQSAGASDSGSKYEPTGYSYRQLGRFKVEQRYDINKANEYHPEPFSPVHGEIEFAPSRYLSLQADTEWSQYESTFLSHNIYVSLSDYRGDRIHVEHRYRRNASESIYYDLLFIIFRRLSAFANYERNIYDGKDIRTELGLLYQSQCWSVDVRYIDEVVDQKYAIMINLYGLGGFGQSFAFKERETETVY